MASDDTRPKVRMLLTIGIVSVFILVGIKFLLDSYYLDMTEGYERSLLPRPELLEETRTQQRAAIDDGKNGAIPVSVAMQTLASKGRDNASAAITPQPSDDVDPLKGWAQLKHELHLPPQVMTTSTPQVPGPPEGDGGVRTSVGDAGAVTHADGGGGHTAPAMATDGGR